MSRATQRKNATAVSRFVLLGASILFAACSSAARVAPGPQSSAVDTYRGDVDRLARPFVDGEWAASLAIGLVHPEGVEFYGLGRVAADDDAPPDAHTAYEIGSITKGFTGLLLADLARTGDARLDEPVAELLGEGWTVPLREGQPIRLEHLAMHRSGLPRMPGNFAPSDPADPYADYTVDRLREFLETHVVERVPMARYEYSNLGAGLLGLALAKRSGKPYETLLRERVLAPLDMTETGVTPAAPRVAQGYNRDGDPVPAWSVPALIGAGGLRSTVADMVRFVRFALEPEGLPLGASMAVASAPRARAGRSGSIGLGWHVTPSGTVWHNGGTAGFHAFVAVRPTDQLGVVLLANTGEKRVDQLGLLLMDLLRGREPTLELPPLAPVSGETLERHVGAYELAPDKRVVVTRREHRLFVQVTGQVALRVYPENDTTFRYRVVPVTITFERDPQGHTTALTFSSSPGAKTVEPPTRCPRL